MVLTRLTITMIFLVCINVIDMNAQIGDQIYADSEMMNAHESRYLTLHTTALEFGDLSQPGYEMDDQDRFNEESNVLAALKYDESVAEGFGSYWNPISHELKIIPQDDKMYTRAQLINKNTGKTVKKVQLKSSNSDLDISDLPSGEYMIILTDEGSSIFVEDFILF